MLEAVDREVLGAVVAKQAVHVRHEANRPDVGHEDCDAQHCLDEVPCNRVGGSIVSYQQVCHRHGNGHEQRNAEEKPQGHRQAKRHGRHRLGRGGRRAIGARRLAAILGNRTRLPRRRHGRHAPGGEQARIRLALVVIRVVARHAHRLVGEQHRLHERDTAPHDGQALPGGPRVRCGQLVLLHVDAAARLAHRGGPAELSSHHDALGKSRSANVGGEQLALLADAVVAMHHAPPLVALLMHARAASSVSLWVPYYAWAAAQSAARPHARASRRCPQEDACPTSPSRCSSTATTTTR